MEIERPHRTTSTPTTTSELFICFTSRLSKSSSMRLSSKSILSPAHTSTIDANKASQNHTLSSSLSRRLRHNGSLRGAQSPAMFPSKKSTNRGSSGFAENPEPSSPKVTCIGQVRVKTKKQGKKMKMRACRSGKRLSGGEASFRRIESGQQDHQGTGNQSQVNQTQECELNHRNQRWVHLPLTICEALRAFGSEFSCLFPCKSSCFTSGLCGGTNNNNNGNESNEKREEREGSGNSSCAVFRWLVSLQEGEEEGVGGQKRRDIELVVGDEEEVEERERRVVMERECSRRRSIFDDMEFDDLFHDMSKSNDKSGEIDGNDDDGNEEGGRLSVCVPPKNALLLMRCRSDPMKMASLSRKLWDPPLPQEVDDVVDDDEEVVAEEERENVVQEVKFEEDVKKVEEEGKLEVGETEEIGDGTVGIEDETREIEDETEEIEGKIENLDEEMGEILEDMELGESKIESLPDFVAENEEMQEGEHKESNEGEEEEKQKEQETEEIQSIENLDEENCEIAEETRFIEDETQLQEDEIIPNRCSIEAFIFEEKVESGENEQELVSNSVESQEVKEEEKIEESSDLSTTISSSSTLNSSEESTAESKEQEEKDEKDTLEEVEAEFEEETTHFEESNKQVILSTIDENPKPSNKPAKLPDCLLLMMCEPKLSMEVSKETWVCSTDFIRWLPERHHSKKATNAKTDGSDESTTAKTKKKTAGVGPPPQPAQPARSSISFPAGSVANLIEQKLVKAGGYEPFVLTRCKSAPIRSTAKIEPHRPATFGVGKAGVGF